MTPHEIRMQVWHQSYKLALGTKTEQEAALRTITKLVNHLNEKKEK